MLYNSNYPYRLGVTHPTSQKLNCMNVPQAAKNGIWLTVDFFILPDKIEEAEALFKQHVADGRKDRGNLFFSMLRHADDPSHFYSLECWETKADIDNHDAQPHHPVFLRKLKEIQAKEKEVIFMNFFAEG